MSLLANEALEAICKAGIVVLAVCTTFNLAPGVAVPIPTLLSNEVLPLPLNSVAPESATSPT